MKIVFFAFLASILIISCTGNKDNSIITFRVDRSDYFEKLNVAGTVQAVVNFPVMPPRRMYGQMTVLRLAADGSFVKKGDTICVLTIPELESNYQGALTSLETLEAGLKRTAADNQLNIALLESQLAISEAQLKISSLDSIRKQFTSPVQQKLLDLEMKKSQIEKEKTEKKLAARKKIGETEIRQMKARIMQENSRAQSMASYVNSMTIVAQRDGIVMRTESPIFRIMGPQGTGSMGGPIQEGSVLFIDSPILQFPDLSKMQVSAEVVEADFKKIEKGQKVLIAVDAAEKLTTTGKVNRKSLMGKTAQKYSDSKVKFYEIIIDLDSCHARLKPGLSATCEITIQEAHDTLFVPTLALYERDSARVVYVMDKESFIPVKVGTGLSGSSYTIITSGLKGDEIIALSEPPDRLIRREKKNIVKADTTNTLNPK